VYCVSKYKMICRVLFVCLFVMALWLPLYAETFYVCEAADSLFLGAYSLGSDTTMDGVAVYSNANDMSLFRNKGFWYLGNLGPWPPETHYRCVEAEGCNQGESLPPTSTQGTWVASKRFGKDPVPIITLEPCTAKADEL